MILTHIHNFTQTFTRSIFSFIGLVSKLDVFPLKMSVWAELMSSRWLVVWMLIKHSQYCYPIIYCHFLQFPMENSEETRGVRQKHGKQQRSWAGIEMGALQLCNSQLESKAKFPPNVKLVESLDWFMLFQSTNTDNRKHAHTVRQL